MENIDYSKEVWKPVPEPYDFYADAYEVSNYGRVRSIDRYIEVKDGSTRFVKGTILKPGHNKKYLKVGMSYKGIQITASIHRLVALAFVGNPHPDKWTDVNHKNEDTHDNTANNLEFCNVKYNNNYGTKNMRASKTHRNTDYDNKTPVIVYNSYGFYKEYGSIREASEKLNIGRMIITNRVQNPKVYTDEYHEYHMKYKNPARTTNNSVANGIGVAGEHYTQGKDIAQRRITEIQPNIIIIGNYTNIRTKCDFKCKNCGYRWSTKPTTILNDKGGCPQCSRKINARKHTMSKNQVQERLDNIFKGNLLIVGEYIKTTVPVLLQCKTCGRRFETTTRRLFKKPKHGGCPMCNRSNQTRYRNLKRYRGEEEARRIMKEEGYEPTVRVDGYKAAVLSN